MKNVIIAVVVLVAAIAGWFGYKYWELQQLAAQYDKSKEVHSAYFKRNGKIWTIEIQSIFVDPADAIWKAMKTPERSAELYPDVFKKSAVVKDEGNKKVVDLEVKLLTLPKQGMTAELTYDDSSRTMEIATSKSAQEIKATYELTPLADNKTLLTFSGTAEEKVALPFPQSVVESALRQLFVAQVRAIDRSIHGIPKEEASKGVTANEVIICEGPFTPDTPKVVTVEIVEAGSDTGPTAEQPRTDTPKGYERVYTIDGVLVKETYDNTTSCTTATGVAGGYKAQLQSVILSPESFESWVKDFKWGQLAAVKPGPDGKVNDDELMPLMPNKPRGWEIVPPMVKPKLGNPLSFRVYEQFLS